MRSMLRNVFVAAIGADLAFVSFRYVAVLLQSFHGYPASLRGNDFLSASIGIVVSIIGCGIMARALWTISDWRGQVAGSAFVLITSIAISSATINVSTLEHMWIGRCDIGNGDACGSLACLYKSPSAGVYSARASADYFARGCRLGDSQSCRRECRPRP
jgi:hypothetical protein